MSHAAIRVVDLTKEYHIGRIQNNFHTLRDSLTGTFASPFRRALGLLRGDASAAAELDQKFVALDHISFDVQPGEVVGIIGRNGAGKSTLLKILSRIVEPSDGYAEINGRTSSLLEVGTGFHPELTGRENVFLSGAVLGMRKTETRRRFDEIVDFSEIARFIDTPVKHYSSGMYVRLAFAVAAHLDPEILIVDEVLAVGDVSFQKKCIRKMQEINRGGRTILLVTHNIATARDFCQRGILLDHGKVVFGGSIKDSLDAYLGLLSQEERTSQASVIDLRHALGRPEGYKPTLKKLELMRDEFTPLSTSLPIGAPLIARLSFEIKEPMANLGAGLGFDSLLGQRIFTAHTAFDGKCKRSGGTGEHVFNCFIPNLDLMPGEYKIKVSLAAENETIDLVEDAARVTIVDSNYYGTGILPWNGMCVMPQRWALDTAPSFVEEA